MWSITFLKALDQCFSSETKNFSIALILQALNDNDQTYYSYALNFS